MAFNMILKISHCSILLLACVVCVTSTKFEHSRSMNLTYDRRTMVKRYQKWQELHGKRYRGRGEWEQRFGIYQSNVEFIDYINSQNLSYKLTDNQFADMTNEEFKELYLGRLERLTSRQSHGVVNVTKQELPKQVDWRKKGAVSSVKNQGTCGSCWAFSAVAAVEGLTKIKRGKLVSLSEQELIDCDHIVNQGCRGGLMEPAFQYIQKSGISPETDYPYRARDGSCDIKKTKKHTVKIRGYRSVPVNNEHSLKAAVAKQPVSVAIDAASFEFQLYSSGVFDGFCGVNLSHGVTVVGYGEHKGKEYWIVKNSWGPNWGEDGYIRMKRNSRKKTGLCGIAMQASYPL